MEFCGLAVISDENPSYYKSPVLADEFIFLRPYVLPGKIPLVSVKPAVVFLRLARF